MVFHLEIDQVLLLTFWLLELYLGWISFDFIFWGDQTRIFCLKYYFTTIYWEHLFYFPVCSYLTNLLKHFGVQRRCYVVSVQLCPTLCDPMDCSTPGFPVHCQLACSNSCPSSRWCHSTISSFAIPFSSCLQSFPASGYLLYFKVIYWMFWL